MSHSPKVAFLYSGGRKQRIERISKKLAADDFLYGAVQFVERGIDTAIVETSESLPAPIVKRIGDFLFKKKLLPHKVNGDVLASVYRVLPQLKTADVVIVAGTPLALALVLFKQLGLIKCRIVGIHAGIFNYSQNYLQTLQMQSFLRGQRLVLFGDGEVEPLRKLLGGIGKWSVNECGTDVTFWTPNGVDGDYILSVGNDSQRDFELLVRVAERLDCKVKIITRKPIDERIPANVELINGDVRKEIISDADLREYYRRALCVVIPLKDSHQPSGQSVCLQAMACGRPVILTETQGLWSKKLIRDGENILLVKPDDDAAMIRAINQLLGSKPMCEAIGASGRATVLSNWTMSLWSARLAQFALS